MKTNLNGFIVEFGHTLDEYERLYKKDYEGGDLWDFSLEDIETNAIKPREDMIYWAIVVDNEIRIFETYQRIEKYSKEKIEEEKIFSAFKYFEWCKQVGYTEDEINRKKEFTDGWYYRIHNKSVKYIRKNTIYQIRRQSCCCSAAVIRYILL